MAGKRIYAARTMRKFPLVGEMVARGELHLTAVCMLAKHLTEQNHREVLARASHRTERELRNLVAELQPLPDVPSQVRRAPRSNGAGPSKKGATEPASRELTSRSQRRLLNNHNVEDCRCRRNDVWRYS